MLPLSIRRHKFLEIGIAGLRRQNRMQTLNACFAKVGRHHGYVNNIDIPVFINI